MNTRFIRTFFGNDLDEVDFSANSYAENYGYKIITASVSVGRDGCYSYIMTVVFERN